MTQYSCGDVVTVKNINMMPIVDADDQVVEPSFWPSEPRFVLGDHWIIDHIHTFTMFSSIFYRLVHMSGTQKTILLGKEMDWYFRPLDE